MTKKIKDKNCSIETTKVNNKPIILHQVELDFRVIANQCSVQRQYQIHKNRFDLKQSHADRISYKQ